MALASVRRSGRPEVVDRLDCNDIVWLLTYAAFLVVGPYGHRLIVKSGLSTTGVANDAAHFRCLC